MASTLKVSTKLGGTASKVIVGKVAVRLADCIRGAYTTETADHLFFLAWTDDYDQQVGPSRILVEP